MEPLGVWKMQAEQLGGFQIESRWMLQEFSLQGLGLGGMTGQRLPNIPKVPRTNQSSILPKFTLWKQ